MPDPKDIPEWAKQDTLNIWEELSERLRSLKSVLAEGKFPVKELLPIFTSHNAQAIEALACWNLIKEYYSDFIVPSTVRMFDLHFDALVTFVTDSNYCVVNTCTPESKKKASTPHIQ